MSTDLDEFAMAKLAREMAMNIRNYKVIFEDFGISEEDFYEISKNEFYQRAKTQFALEWNSSLSATERVKYISAAYLEQVLPVIGAKALNREENLGAATDVAKFLARNAGIGEPKNDAKTAAERFVIQINLGADVDGKPIVEKFDKSVEVDANDVGFGGRASEPKQLALPGLSAEDAALEAFLSMED
ncbi:MAG TPA: hypothetical protein VF077_09975 [Nitrospiraceae bacterium]